MGKELKSRLADGEAIVTSWSKIPHPSAVEVLALAGLDAVILDAEHSPFDRASLDLSILAGRASGIPVLVRTLTGQPHELQAVLDMGAAGVVVPHVRSPAQARDIVRACRFEPSGRGYSSATRAGGYTTKPAAAHRMAHRDLLLVAQIEDAEALTDLDGIVATDGIDAVLIGQADLAVSLGVSQDDPALDQAVGRIIAACSLVGRPYGVYLANHGHLPKWRARGAGLFIIGSDQGFILAGARALVDAVDQIR